MHLLDSGKYIVTLNMQGYAQQEGTLAVNVGSDARTPSRHASHSDRGGRPTPAPQLSALLPAGANGAANGGRGGGEDGSGTATGPTGSTPVGAAPVSGGGDTLTFLTQPVRPTVPSTSFSTNGSLEVP
jgi:hypothetical protein